MFEWLKIKWANRRSRKLDTFKRDEYGHALANRTDVDDYPNEPGDIEIPPIRLPKGKKARARLWDSVYRFPAPKN
ncbi:MAG: hypothetical protein KC478_08135 [Bacteriovoracaceae bacterium]|nr:hypothetical protein [Bacteriovoracaceae bacterium]